ncbi:thioredoxin family protein [Flavimarina sp. Hel_I_48]|uniref:thioredoxin family protein n=1 Tax=Flavimarina sp. Hel_I_48 TaxID=1392488 RepID=UPI0004DF53CC|nr:thioredoxin fold domain-containing protein [Flavimarina sp. Hel_I_48]
MKTLFTALIILVFVHILPAQSKIKWMNMNEALSAQKENPKKIFMDVYTDWCGPCKLLDKNTFSNDDVATYINENFYPVKFNAEGTEEITYKDFKYTNPNHDPDRKGRNSQHFLAHALKINAYPSMVFFNESGDLIQPVPGYHTPKQLELFLKLVATDAYKEVTTSEAWKKYQDNFVSTFKE